MPRQLTSDLTLDSLKKEAKRWLKALRDERPGRPRALRARAARCSSDADAARRAARARARVRSPRMDGAQAGAGRARTPSRCGTPPLDVVSRFLDNACPDHHVRGGSDHVRAAAHRDAAPRSLSRDRPRQLLHRGRLRRPRRGQPRACGRPRLGDAHGWRARIAAHGRRRRGRSREAGLGRKGLGAALVSLLHTPPVAGRRRQRRRDRPSLAGPRRRSQRPFHGRRQPLHAAGRCHRRRRRGPTGAPGAKRARQIAARSRRRAL